MSDYREEADRLYEWAAYGGFYGSLLFVFFFALLFFITLLDGNYFPPFLSILFFIFVVLGIVALVASYRRVRKYEEYMKSHYAMMKLLSAYLKKFTNRKVDRTCK